MPSCSGVSLRRQVAERVFPIDEKRRGWADEVVRDRSICIAEVASITNPLALYRYHGRNLSGITRSPNLADVQKRLKLMQELYADRVEFALRQHSVRISHDELERIGSPEIRLAERLLKSEGIDEALVRSIVVGWRERFWRVIFACPRPLGIKLLSLYWGQSRITTFLKWLPGRMLRSDRRRLR
jgi:hypothetical protein